MKKGMGLYFVSEILAITGIRIRENGVFGQGARFELIVPNGKFKFE
jgi:signal transduction histidine kinase